KLAKIGESGLYLLLALQHQNSALRHDKVFLTLIQHFCSAADEKNSNISFPSLERYIFHLFILVLPWLRVYRHWDRIPRAGLDNISLLDLFLFLDPRGKIQTGFGPFIWTGRLDQD